MMITIPYYFLLLPEYYFLGFVCYVCNTHIYTQKYIYILSAFLQLACSCAKTNDDTFQTTKPAVSFLVISLFDPAHFLSAWSQPMMTTNCFNYSHHTRMPKCVNANIQQKRSLSLEKFTNQTFYVRLGKTHMHTKVMCVYKFVYLCWETFDDKNSSKLNSTSDQQAAQNTVAVVFR